MQLVLAAVPALHGCSEGLPLVAWPAQGHPRPTHAGQYCDALFRSVALQAANNNGIALQELMCRLAELHVQCEVAACCNKAVPEAGVDNDSLASGSITKCLEQACTAVEEAVVQAFEAQALGPSRGLQQESEQPCTGGTGEEGLSVWAKAPAQKASCAPSPWARLRSMGSRLAVSASPIHPLKWIRWSPALLLGLRCVFGWPSLKAVALLAAGGAASCVFGLGLCFVWFIWSRRRPDADWRGEIYDSLKLLPAPLLSILGWSPVVLVGLHILFGWPSLKALVLLAVGGAAACVFGLGATMVVLMVLFKFFKREED